MELNERKSKILQVIIQTYLETGEPVGSRTISKMSDLNLSSATIRNEMSDLEELGYIVQPHTSAGRIPSDKGYRFYVDNIMKEKEREISDMRSFVVEHTERMEQVLKEMAKLLAANTNYATLISAPQSHGNRLKFIQLSPVDEGQILCTVVLEGNIVKNKIIATDQFLDQEEILKLNILLNTTLNGLDTEQITLNLIARLKEQAGIHSGIVGDILDAIAETINTDEDLEVYMSGAKNIFRYPELSDTQRASGLISLLEDKSELKNLLVDKSADIDDSDIKVYIGSESQVEEMEDCSVVTATYELGDGLRGAIGIVGPKRMDYEKVMDSIKTVKKQLDTMYPKKKKEQEDIGD